MCRELKSTTPRTRLAGQQSEGKKEKFYEHNDNGFIKLEPPPWQVSIYIKSLLVQLGTRGIIPNHFCAQLINLLKVGGVRHGCC